jgi:hypothetical protein
MEQQTDNRQQTMEQQSINNRDYEAANKKNNKHS